MFLVFLVSESLDWFKPITKESETESLKEPTQKSRLFTNLFDSLDSESILLFYFLHRDFLKFFIKTF